MAAFQDQLFQVVVFGFEEEPSRARPGELGEVDAPLAVELDAFGTQAAALLWIGLAFTARRVVSG